jgi:hypothetical protein
VIDQLREAWAVYQLANDRTTYGESAGKWIIVCSEDEIEVCGVIGELSVAEHIVALHNRSIGVTR